MKVKSIRFPYLRYGLMLIIMTTAYYVAGRLALLLAIPAGLVFTGLLGVFLLVVTGYIARVEQLAAELSETNTDMKREIAEQKRQKQLLRENEEQIRASLRGKELQLKEIHHRVKNNLQIIASLLDLQSESITVSQVLQTFQESQNRIRSMVPIHEHLYESGDLAQIDCGQYTQELAYHLFNSYEARTRGIIPELDVDAIFLGIDTAIPCGLILNGNFRYNSLLVFPQSRIASDLLKYDFLPKIF